MPPKLFSYHPRSQLYEDHCDTVPLKISHYLADKMGTVWIDSGEGVESPVSLISEIIIHTFERYGRMGIKKSV